MTSSSGQQGESPIAIAGAATALITVLSALAVTGALQRTQRDHGVALIIAFIFVLVAAAVWLALALVKAGLPAATTAKRWWSWTDLSLRLFTAVLFLVGIITGIYAMIDTQNDHERPTVTAVLDPDTLVLTATATARNLNTEGRMVTLIVGLTRTANGILHENRYVAISGPDRDGNATQQVSYRFAGTNYTAVGVSASTGHTSGCDYVREIGTTSQDQDTSQIWAPIQSVISQPDLPGCVVIYLPKQATQ
jgi:hypothetical protein